MTSEVKSTTGQKKKYSPPGFAVLTPDQAKSRLMESALPEQIATQQLLKAASRLGSRSSSEQRRNGDGTQLRKLA